MRLVRLRRRRFVGAFFRTEAGSFPVQKQTADGGLFLLPKLRDVVRLGQIYRANLCQKSQTK